MWVVHKTAKNQQVEDCYIVTDNMPTQQYEVLIWLAKQQDIDISDTKTPTAWGGKRLSNKRLSDTGFQLKYPNYKAGYSAILQNL